tara:strand:- start:7301 stop:8920 length:1620 start_codon:yes stop_codon:yes gene_type:complete
MSDYSRLRTPFTSMSFTPDVPSNALGPNEYNSGKNIEADVRCIKKIFGEIQIASTIADKPIFVEGGFRSQTSWVYIVATRNSSNQGKWFMITATGISNITPGVGANPSAFIAGYTEDINITTSWVGNVFFINDTIQNPMYFLPTGNEITVTPDASWNYDVGVTSTRAAFVRNFCSPNVGNILISGNLTKVIGGTTYNYPTTVRWSQAFANQGYPVTWEPTLSNVANEQEVPVRGPLIDGFFLGGSFYVCSYWDTVVFSPISYQNSTAPIFGLRLFNQGRGLFNNNCWTNTDANVYGVDARDIWVFNGSEFSSLGNQKVKNYFFANLSPLYASRIFMVNNTSKSQIEIYYPDLTSTGWCNKMLSWRYDLQVWNAPKDVQNACMGTEGPRWIDSSTDYFNLASRAVVYARGGVDNSRLVETATGNSFVGSAIDSEFERTNIALQTANGPVPYSSKVYIHRVLPEIAGTGAVNITVGGANSTAQATTYGETGKTNIDTDTPWVPTQQNTFRTVAVKFGSNDATDTWKMSALNMQATVTEDAF